MKEEQREKLVQGIADRFKQSWKKEWAELRKHEVSYHDAQGILTEAWRQGGEVPFAEMEAEAPEKPRPKDA